MDYYREEVLIYTYYTIFVLVSNVLLFLTLYYSETQKGNET